MFSKQNLATKDDNVLSSSKTMSDIFYINVLQNFVYRIIYIKMSLRKMTLRNICEINLKRFKINLYYKIFFLPIVSLHKIEMVMNSFQSNYKTY